MDKLTDPIVMMTRADLSALIYESTRSAVEAVLGRSKSDDDSALWDAKKVAEFFGVTSYTVAHDWAHKKGFPAAVVLGTGPKAQRRWRAEDVRAWLGFKGR